ncbi:MAG: patatin-like phospholipase family protein [Gammaproteobacteria bacterium]|nr:patatin-like phospholipase family protein [Gammaproteobacteria bacterium]
MQLAGFQLSRLTKGLLIIAVIAIAASILLNVFGSNTIQTTLLLRVPLLTGLFLFGLPFLAVYGLPSMLRNLFVLESSLRLTMVIIQTAVTGLGIVFVWSIIDLNAGCRFLGESCTKTPDTLDTGTVVPYLWGIILASPVAFTAYKLSELDSRQKLIGLASGVIAVIILYYTIHEIRISDSSVTLGVTAKTLVWLLTLILPKSGLAGFIDPETGELAAGHLLGLSFLLVTGGIYFISYFFFRPSPKPGKLQAPALHYLLVLIIAFTFVFGLTTFLLDYYRIPAMLIALLFSWAMFTAFDTDHFFKVIPVPHKTDNSTVQQVLQNRMKLNNDGTLVIVCASGGGIQAAGWTAMVLIKLQQLLGQRFANAIGLISSVSGGSVGAMHYLDSSVAIPDPDKKQLFTIFQNATVNSLDATGWGMAYPDLWRIAGAPFLPSKLNDRGQAIEDSWKQVMYNGNATLLDWQVKMSDGALPIAVFNSTQVENGQRFLLSPVSLTQTTNQQNIDFNALYPHHDMDVTSAARLSATFPYISPVARDSDNIHDFHCADGGYFDNFGVFTASQWLTDEVLPIQDKLNLKRIIFIEIRAFARPLHPELSADKERVIKPSGWLMALLGPLLAVTSVRNATQNTRNEYDVDVMQECQSRGLDFHRFVFEFPREIEFFDTPVPDLVETIAEKMNSEADQQLNQNQLKQYQPPLSWKLSNKQKKTIWKGWYQIEHDPSAFSYQELQDLIKLWKS